MWAEEIGVGDMGLMPEQFWGLTMHEFNLKRAAFMRSEDRMRALMMEHSLMAGGRDENQQLKLERAINSLRRYAMKKWLVDG